MAASSSFSGPPYDAFLCHRGPDTKRSFSIWLRNELENQQMRVFFDDRSLEAGDNAGASMDAAMQGAEWGVIVLSPGFFASGYCMKELKTFLDRGRAILIGFEVKATDVDADRIVEQAPGSVWEQHGGRLWESCSGGGGDWSEKEWRETVKRAKGVTILELAKFDGYWDTCIEAAVSAVGKKLNKPVASLRARVDMTPFHRNKDFIGRDGDLVRVKQALDSFGTACISGLGGMGKTQLALEYIYRHKRKFARILWVDAESQGLESGYLALAGHLGVQLKQEGSSAGSDAAKESGRSAIEHIREALEMSRVPCLLVLDNIEDQHSLTPLLPRTGPCHVIVTSRLSHITNLGMVPLEVLSKESALVLLTGDRTFDETEEKCLEDLARRFGYLPLPLAVSAQLFAERRIQPSGLLEKLDRKGPNVFERELADPTFHKHPDIVQLFETSFDMLDADTRATPVEKALAKNLVLVAGWFASAPISTELLGAAGLELTKNQSQSESSEGGATNVDSLQEALGLLGSCGLATVTFGERVAFHVLVQDFGRWKGQHEAGHAMVQAVLGVGEVRRDLEHFEHAFSLTVPSIREEKAGLSLDRSTSLQVIDKVGLSLSDDLIRLSYQPSQAMQVVNRCEAFLCKLHVTEGSVLASVLCEKAGALCALFEYSLADTVAKRALELQVDVSGPEHVGAARFYNCLAWVLKEQGQFIEAEPMYRRALKIMEEKLGPSHPETAGSVNNLANLLEKRGTLIEAESLYRRSLEIWEEKLGHTHPETAGSLNNLANVLRKQSKPVEAESMHRRALAIREKELGPTHPQTASSLYNLARLLRDQRRFSEAEPLHRRALAIREKELGPNHPQTAASLHNLARSLWDQGKFAEAEPLHRRILAIDEKELGPTHPRTAETLDQLAHSLGEQGKFSEAEPLHRRILAIREKELGLTHPDTARALNGLAVILEQQGRSKEALPLYERATQIAEAVFEPEHPDVKGYKANLKRVLKVEKRRQNHVRSFLRERGVFLLNGEGLATVSRLEK